MLGDMWRVYRKRMLAFFFLVVSMFKTDDYGGKKGKKRKKNDTPDVRTPLFIKHWTVKGPWTQVF